MFLEKFPKEIGVYVILIKDEPFVIKLISITEDFGLCVYDSNRFYISKKDWNMYTLNGDFYGEITGFKSLKNCIFRDPDIDSWIRLQLDGKEIVLEEKQYKILRVSHHCHLWTIFAIEEKETRKVKELMVEERNIYRLSSPEGWKIVK